MGRDSDRDCEEEGEGGEGVRMLSASFRTAWGGGFRSLKGRSRVLLARVFSSTCFHVRMKLILFPKVSIASCCRVAL